jgi:biopolymer transport protein ExbD
MNLAPLIDVIFILLVFVVLAARFSDQERLDVDVPSAAAGRSGEVDALFVEITAEGETLLEGRRLAGPDLLDVLRERRRRYQRLLVVAEREVALQRAVDVISAGKLAGFEAVAIATRPPEEE